MDEHETTSKTLKRRGILAAAGAVVAGIIAKQTSAPVSATGTPITTGDTIPANSTTTLDATTSITPSPKPAFVVKHNYTGNIDAHPDGVSAYAGGANNAGVFGRNNDLNGVGVWGEAPNGTGLFGDSVSRSGVAGNSSASGIGGVFGTSSASTGIGVQGQADSALAVGVSGTSVQGIGASFQGGRAPVLLIPGTVSMASLTVTGHQAGEIYVTSDDHLMFFTGVAWHEVLLGPPASLPQAQPSVSVQQSAPAPIPPRQPSGLTAPSGSPSPLPSHR